MMEDQYIVENTRGDGDNDNSSQGRLWLNTKSHAHHLHVTSEGIGQGVPPDVLLVIARA